MPKREVLYGRTTLGQAVYDVYFSRLSAAEVAKRHGFKREFVLKARKDPLRKQVLREREKGMKQNHMKS